MWCVPKPVSAISNRWWGRMNWPDGVFELGLGRDPVSGIITSCDAFLDEVVDSTVALIRIFASLDIYSNMTDEVFI